jgi:MFS family permease
MSITAPTEQPIPSSVWQKPLRGLTLGLVLVVVAGAFEALAVATIMPAAVRDLSGMELYGWAFSGFTLTNLIGISVGGSEGARLGAVRLLLLGTAVFCTGLIVAALAPAMVIVVIGRLLQGFGSGLLYTVAYAAIPRAYHQELRPRMLATLSTAWVIPGLVGPGVAGLAATAVGWRWVFGGLLPMPLIAAALVVPALRALPPSAPAPRRSGTVLNALLLSGGVGCLLSGLGQTHPALAALLILGGAVLAGRALAQLLPKGTLRARPGQPAAIAAMSLLTFSFFGSEAFVPLALSHVRGMPIAWSGVPLTAASLTWTAGAWLPVRYAGRILRRTLVLSGLAVLSIGLAGTALVLWPSLPAETIILSWSIAGFGMGIAFTTTSAAVLDGVDDASSDQSSAALQLAQALGAALATGIGGAIVATSIAGDPPRLGIALVDGLMLLFVGACALAARGITGRA